MRLIIFVCFVFLAFSAHSQYRKMPFDTATRWVEKSQSYFGPDPYQMPVCYGTLKVKKDSVYNSKLYHYIKDFNYNNCLTVAACLREDTLLKRIMILVPPNEYILYNFNKNTGDTALLYSNYNMMDTLLTFTVTSKDSVLLNDGNYHRRMVLNAGSSYTVIEGVGGLSGLTTPYGVTFETYYTLLCMSKNYNYASTVYHYLGNGNSCSEPIINSLHKNQIDPNLKLYPLPASDVITLEYNLSEVKLEIVALDGKAIPVQDVKLSGTEHQINVSSLQAGVYFIQVHSENGILRKKLIIQR